MSKEQRMHLDGRIAVAKDRLRTKLTGKPTSAERELERIQRSYERRANVAYKRLSALRQRRKDRAARELAKRSNAVREAMLFGDAKKALAAVKLLEKAAGR